MAANGMIGNGVRIGYRVPASPENAFTPIGQLLSMSDLEIVRDTVDRTIHSTSIYKRSLPGMAAVSDITLTILQDMDETTVGVGVTQKALRDYVVSGTTLEWRCEIPTARDQSKFKAFEFDAFIKSFKIGTTIEDKQVFEVGVVFDGAAFTEINAAVAASSELD
jgi:hypothetical protein